MRTPSDTPLTRSESALIFISLPLLDGGLHAAAAERIFEQDLGSVTWSRVQIARMQQ
jgi:hypothetical protein